MKQLPIIILGLFIMSLFFIYGCDKDDHYYSGVAPIASVTKDSLAGSAWLQNSNGDTTSVFEKGEIITVGISVENFKKEMIYTSFYIIDSKVYRSDDNRFMGHPQFYPRESVFTIWHILSKETGNDFYYIDNGKIKENIVLPTGKYYINLNFNADFYDLDTLNLPKWKLKGNMTFSDLKINFKIK